MASHLNSFERAARHPVTLNRPAAQFFDGALLGNGGLGVVVMTRPDAVVLYLGHNNVWDIRVAEDHADKVGTFNDLFNRIKSIWENGGSVKTDQWLKSYLDMAGANYYKPYPRPFPCGAVVLGFDRRKVELLGHRLDISTGVCEVDLLIGQKPARLQIFVDTSADRVWLRTLDSNGKPTASPFERIRLMPDPQTPKEFPSFETGGDDRAGTLSFRQVLPRHETGVADSGDRAFVLTARVGGALGRSSRRGWDGNLIEMGPLERSLPADGNFVTCIQLNEGLASTVTAPSVSAPDLQQLDSAAKSSRAHWSEFWSKSGVALDDDAFLEATWYRNLYFLNCSVRPGVTCPGLFANWSFRDIGTAWHGDYHMNYNTQQPFWVTFSSNHLDLHLPYVDLVDHLLPISRKWARDYYGLDGAYFPHSAYPTEMNIMPYWVPTWAWEICETPWTVQSLWWHWLYSQDKAFLRDRAFGPIKEAVTFLVAYMRRPETHGPQWKDDKFHIFPTVAPELYGLTDRFEKNFDCLVDLTLTKFVFHAYLKATELLGNTGSERELVAHVKHLLAHFPDYPTAESKERGTVLVSVPGEDPEIVYNCPNSTVTVFPGEEHGLHSPKDEFDLAARTYRQHVNEGGNELVFLNLQGARLGLLDLERFKRQVNYCMLPNGTCTDKALQVHGRYGDDTPFDFMERMGIWFENFALPVVINECLMQSYNGEVRLFPNWPKEKPAEFRTLRAAGAFLVSAACAGGKVLWVEVLSETGSTLRLINPWDGPVRVTTNERDQTVTGARIELAISAGQRIRMVHAQ